MAGVRRFEDLIAWQVSVTLRDRVFELTRSGAVARDRGFVDQIRDSARSAPRNLAEGFGRYKPRQFAHFARIARASIHETRNHVEEARSKAYFSSPDVDEILGLVKRADVATLRLLRYLESCDDSPTSAEDRPPEENP